MSNFSVITTQSFSVRPATEADCPGILECLRLAFAPYRDQYTTEGFLDTVLTSETVGPRMQEMSVFVAEANSVIVGTIACTVMGDGEGHLRGMAVRPEWQGSRISAHLMERAFDELRRIGCKTVTLDTTAPLHRAIRFYEKNGFRATGKVTDFFGMPLFEYSRTL